MGGNNTYARPDDLIRETYMFEKNRNVSRKKKHFLFKQEHNHGTSNMDYISHTFTPVSAMCMHVPVFLRMVQKHIRDNYTLTTGNQK